MSSIAKMKFQRQARRKARVRGAVRGVTDLPRLSVFRSLKNIYAQIIDDASGRTLVSAGSLEKSIRGSLGAGGGNVKAAALIGTAIAEKAREKNITRVAFDRGSYRFHGRIKALAEAARAAGLKF